MPKNDLNVMQLRQQFPIFNQSGNRKPIVYFDSASTAQMPQKVVDVIVDYYTKYKANVGRGIYSFAEQATAAYEGARQAVAKFIGAEKNQIIFTSGATESINIVAQSWVAHHLQEGDEILISAVEHHSNFLPWQQLALHKKLMLKVVPVTAQGVVDPAEFKKMLSFKTKFVSIVHTSNVTGGTNDVTLLTNMAHAVGAKILIDASQSIAHQAIDVAKIGADFLVFSGHKLFGPTGIGILYVALDLINQMRAQKFGGGMVFSVDEQNSEFKKFPHCFEAGTPNVAGAIGIGAAINFVQKNIDFSALYQHETELCTMLIAGLTAIKDVTIISSLDASHVITFFSNSYHAHDIAAHLDRFGIAVRAGHHCVQLFHQKIKVNASVRVSFSAYNTCNEVVYFLDALKKLLQ